MARKKVPQSARLSAGGGQILFGQCPNVGGVNPKGSSLTSKYKRILSWHGILTYDTNDLILHHGQHIEAPQAMILQLKI